MTLVQNEPKAIKIGIPKDDYSAMQGPCPDGFHIPSKDEWVALCGILTTTFGLASNATTMGIYLKMPKNGCRAYSNYIDLQGTYGRYWSCTPSSAETYILNFYSSNINPQSSYNRAYGFAVRCFKDTQVIPTSSWTTLYDGSSIETGAGVFWNSTDGLISVSGDGQTYYTIMDKNIGATTVYSDGDTLSEANCGKYYQWGNNYGFPRTGSVTASSTRVNASTYGPGNYYSSSTFIAVSDDPYDWSSVQNDNLWGGVTGVVQTTDTDIKKVYLGSTQVRPPVLPDYLCFTATVAGRTIRLAKNGSPTAVSLEISTDGATWSDYTIGDTITFSNVGDKVYFRNKSETTVGFGTSSSNFYQFVMSNNYGGIAASGDINYLLNKNSTDTIPTEYCFMSLFGGQKALETPPKLPATTITAHCYDNMFNSCYRLNCLPELPATELKNYCYNGMFYMSTNIQLSTTQTGEYQTPYRIPTTGTGTTASYALDNMFSYTGGTLTGTPSINTTYYTANTVV